MAFKDIFKRKEGGTLLGNMVRGVVNNASGGLLGNGALMLKPGQTVAANNTAAAKAVGASAVTFNAVAGTSSGAAPASGSFGASVKSGAVLQWIKEHWYIVALPVVGVLAWFIVRKNKKHSRKW